jgi:hypothetical protein
MTLRSLGDSAGERRRKLRDVLEEAPFLVGLCLVGDGRHLLPLVGLHAEQRVAGGEADEAVGVLERRPQDGDRLTGRRSHLAEA